MFGSSLPPVVCRRAYLHYLCLFAHSGVQHILCFVCLCLVYPMLSESLDCPFVLCTLCWQFLWIVPSSCVPYVVRVSGLSLRLVYPMLAVSLDCPFVLCTLCCPSLWIVPSSCVPYVVRVSGLSLRLVYPMLAVSLDCPFVLCTRCCPSLWIVPSSCVPDVVRVSGLSIRYSLTFIFMIKSRVMSTTSCI